jgi:hypothetical protein
LTITVGDRVIDRQRLAEPSVQRQQAILYEVLGQLPVAGKHVGETGQAERMLRGERRERHGLSIHGIPPGDADCRSRWLHTGLNAVGAPIRCDDQQFGCRRSR